MTGTKQSDRLLPDGEVTISGRMQVETSPGTGSSAVTGHFPGLEITASWILGFGLVLFLAANGGGFAVTLFGQAGIFVWLILLLGALLGLFPSARPGRSAWTGIALLAALSGWAALGFLWTDTPDKTLVEVARFSAYTSIFVIAIASRGRRHLPHQIGAVGTAIAAVAGLALLSRFFPDLFPEAARTGEILTSEASRLSFPIDYWNGLGALLALGLPLMVQASRATRLAPLRVAAITSLPLTLLALYFTFSRGSLLAAAAALLVFHLLVRDPRSLAVTAVGLAGGFILVALAGARPALREGLATEAARNEGLGMFWLTLLVCLATGLAGWALLRWLERLQLPAWPRPGRRAMLAGGAAVVVLVVAGLAVIGAPERVTDAWHDFKSSETPTRGSARLGAAAGNGRYQLWSSALRQFESAPVAGRGGGSFEYWWAERGDRPGFVRDAHSLYFQTLAEYGLIGFLLLGGLLGLLLAVALTRASSGDLAAPWVAAALAGCVAFMVSAALDWVWQLPAIVAAFLLLAASILAQPGDLLQRQVGRHAERRRPERIAFSGLALAGVLIAIVPVSAAILIQRSQEEVRQGELAAALDSAAAARQISPGTAAPLIQEAGILSLDGHPDAAKAKAGKATRAEPANWRNWYVLSEMQRQAGDKRAAAASMERARKLNPRSTLFAD